MQVYHDEHADLRRLDGKRIAVIGYGNQGRSQALNLRDSGLEIIVGNQDDAYAERARQDGFTVLPIDQAADEADVVVLLIPDEVVPRVFETQIAPHLIEGNTVVFASGYNVAFGSIAPPSGVDVVLLAPRMIGAGVRELYVAGRGFPAFIGVARDHSGRARDTALALAKGIGSTRAGVVEVSFAQEAELDLFTEQCFGPAFGHVLTTAVDLLLEEGYPPEAILLELYLSGELSYTLGKIAEMGLVEQSQLHSPTSQYGSMSRGMRFILPELRTKMRQGLEEIRSGAFAREWAAEQEAGRPTLAVLKEAARSLPLHALEAELLQKLRSAPTATRPQNDPFPHPNEALADLFRAGSGKVTTGHAPRPSTQKSITLAQAGLAGFLRRNLRGLRAPRRHVRETPGAPPHTEALSAAQMQDVLRRFTFHAVNDVALQEFAADRQLTTHYLLSDLELEFHLRFQDGEVSGDLGPPSSEAEVCLRTVGDVLDGMFTGRINAMRAAMTGKLSFSGDTRLALSIQQIQTDLGRLYVQAREEALAERS